MSAASPPSGGVPPRHAAATPSPGAPEPVARSLRPRIGLIAGPLVFALMLIAAPPAGLSPAAWRTAAVAVLMAVWWITEAIPIPVTALLPLVLFPPLEVADIGAAAAPFANPVIYLFMGGFLIARAMERWELHRRFAMRIIRAVGSGRRGLVGGFMAASAFLSMWMSNTATTIMMLPIASSVIAMAHAGGASSGGTSGPAAREHDRFGAALMLGIAYAASIGGIATLIGTPPNALLAGFMSENYGVEIGFARWLIVGLPLAALMLPIAWLVLVRVAFPLGSGSIPGGREALVEAAARLGRPSRGEWITGTVFVVVAVAWVAGPLLGRWIPGLTDAGIAMTGAVALFVLPVDARRGVFVLDWTSAARIPWGVLVLFGGGLSLARAIATSGLAEWIGHAMSGFSGLPVLGVMFVVTLIVIFLTEMTSNTATAATFLPIVASFAVGMGHDPLLFAVPAVLAASCAFMLPVATPPNAIVYASGAVSVPQMSRAGLILNLAFSVLIPLAAWALLMLAFGIRPA